MKIWPVPDSYSKNIPKDGKPGSFWDNRGDRYHCGVDIFAPDGSVVLSIQNGKVIDIGLFTNPVNGDFWNKTYYITIKSSQNINVKYAQLAEVCVKIGDFINSGQKIGTIGLIIDEKKISHSTPQYARDMAANGQISSLHLEAYIAPISEVRPYFSGNFLGEEKPYSLIDPALFLNGLAKSKETDNN